MSGKQARRRRRMLGSHGTRRKSDRDQGLAEKVGKARADRDRQLGLLQVEIDDLRAQLAEEAAKRRRAIWAEYDERVRLIEPAA